MVGGERRNRRDGDFAEDARPPETPTEGKGQTVALGKWRRRGLGGAACSLAALRFLQCALCQYGCMCQWWDASVGLPNNIFLSYHSNHQLQLAQQYFSFTPFQLQLQPAKRND